MRVFAKLFLIGTLLIGAAALFAVCSEEETGTCYAGLLDNLAPKVSKNLVECPYAICVSTEVPKTESNPEGGYSAGYCSKGCESEADCEEGFICGEVISKESVKELEDRGYVSEFAGKSFCKNPAPPKATDEQIKESKKIYAQNEFERFLQFCYLEDKKEGSEGCEGNFGKAIYTDIKEEYCCDVQLSGFCAQNEVINTLMEFKDSIEVVLGEKSYKYNDECCNSQLYIFGLGGPYCCQKNFPADENDVCCQSITFLEECIKDNDCKQRVNTACKTAY